MIKKAKFRLVGVFDWVRWISNAGLFEEDGREEESDWHGVEGF
jgi:hypothetical protein